MAKKKKAVKKSKSAPKKKTAKKAVKKPAKKAVKKKVSRKAAPKKKAKRKISTPVVAPLLSVGQSAPPFSLANENGETISSTSLLGKRVVLYFYPKDDTPGCTQESCDFRDSFSRVQAQGAIVLGVSKDSVASHVKFKQKYSLPFSLLSDEDGRTCEAYGVWKEKSMYGRKYMGIERTTFIIGSDGKIAKIYPKVSVTGHVDQVLQDLESVS